MNFLKRNLSISGILLLHLFILLTLKYTAWPEMLAYPYLLSRGFRFYEDIVHPYLPLLPYLVLGVSQITGFTVVTLQIITYLTLFFSDMIVWKIVRQWFSQRGAILTLIGYVWFTSVFDGNGLWFDLFLTPFLIVSWYLCSQYLRFRRLETLYQASLILGLATLIKQTAVIFEVLVLILAFRKKSLRSVLYAVVIFLIPFLVGMVLFSFAAVWKWGIVFPFTAISHLPGYILYPSVKQLIYLFLTFSPVLFWLKIKDHRVLLIGCWFLFSLVFLFPRFDYFHLQPALPFFVIGTAFVVSKLKKNLLFYIMSVVYLLLIVGLGIRTFSKNFNQPPRFFSSGTYVVGSYLDSLLPNDEPIFFYNTPANFFVAATLLPVKPWVDNFPWYMELPMMQEQLVAALESNKVRLVVFTEFGSGKKYEPCTYKPDVLDQYIKNNFIPESSVTEQIKVLRRIP